MVIEASKNRVSLHHLIVRISPHHLPTNYPNGLISVFLHTFIFPIDGPLSLSPHTTTLPNLVIFLFSDLLISHSTVLPIGTNEPSFSKWSQFPQVQALFAHQPLLHLPKTGSDKLKTLKHQYVALGTMRHDSACFDMYLAYPRQLGKSQAHTLADVLLGQNAKTQRQPVGDPSTNPCAGIHFRASTLPKHLLKLLGVAQ